MLNVTIGLLNVTNRLLYIDPAATSVLLASLTSIAVVAGAVFIILWRKLKKGVKKTLHIDENAGKEVEDELVVTDEELAEGEAEKTEVAETADTDETATAEEPVAEAETEEKTEETKEVSEKTAEITE